jgi:MoaA/NifB/PqqE/SkfB family radical SAM enzyme
MSDRFSSYDFSQIPFDDIVKVGQRSMIYRDIFNVSWLLGRYCNYKCSYCWPYARSDEKDHRPLPILIKTMDSIKEQARANGFNSFHFSFSGGEPTVHPDYLKLLEYYSNDSDNCNFQSCHMTSNLSRTEKWFQKYADVTKDLHRVSVTASWHREMSDKEKFKNKILLLQENDIYVTINMVMVPSMFEEFYDEALYFNDAGINVTLKPQSNLSASKIVEGYTIEQWKLLHNGMPQRDYTAYQLEQIKKKVTRPSLPESFKTFGQPTSSEEKIPQKMQVELVDKNDKKWYLDQAERFNAFEFNKFKGWMCNAGFQGIVIREPDGSVKRSYSCHDAPLGNIETGFKIFDGPRPCIADSCVSSVDSKIPKYKIYEK